MRRRAGAVVASLRARIGLLAALALAGAIAGLCIAWADEPRHAAVATIVLGEVSEAGELTIFDAGAVDAAERLAEIVGSREVALEAAAELDGDVAGADLLALTTASAASPGVVEIESVSERPELSVAAANAFARATVEVVSTRQRRALRRADGELRERLAELEPGSEEAVAVDADLAAIAEALAGADPVLLGASAQRARETGGSSPAGLTLVGGAAGLLGGGLFVAAVALRRRLIHDPRQIESAGAGRGLTVIETRRLSRAVRSPSPGALELDAVEGDSARSLVAELGLLDSEPGSALAVTSPMPGDGRTSVSLAVAAAAASAGLRVLLMEADMRNPGLAERLRIPEGYGLSDYLVGDAAPREVMRTIPLRSGAPSDTPPLLVCVPAGRSDAAPAELLGGGRFSRLVDRVRRVYDLVVFDTAPLLPTTEGAATATAVGSSIIVLRAARSTETELSRSLRLLERSRVEAAVLVGLAGEPATIRRVATRSKR